MELLKNTTRLKDKEIITTIESLSNGYDIFHDIINLILVKNIEIYNGDFIEISGYKGDTFTIRFEIREQRNGVNYSNKDCNVIQIKIIATVFYNNKIVYKEKIKDCANHYPFKK